MFRRFALLVLCLLPAPVFAQDNLREDLDALRSLVEEQQTRITQLNDVVDQQQQRLDTIGQDVADFERDNNSDAYDGGFLISGIGGTPDEVFRMRIGSWGQLRYNHFDSDGPNRDQNDLDIERLRLVFDGYAFNPTFRYFFQLDADSDAAETVDMLDYYITYDFGHDMLCYEKNRLALRLGKWKIGFNRAREESGTRMQFSDRSVASVLFDFDRSLGVGLLGTLTPAIGQIDWQVAITNGIDTGGYRPNRIELDTNFAVATRVNWLACGDWGKDGHADLECRTRPAVRFGTGFTHGRRDLEGIREFAFPRVVDSGALISSILPANVSSYGHTMYSVDMNTKYLGWSTVFEYYFRQLSEFRGDAVPDLYDHGYWAELGWFLCPGTVQLIARHSHIVGDSGTLGAVDQSADEVAAGIVFYAIQHRMKLTFDVTRLNGAPIRDTALSIFPGDDGTLYRSQFQWKF